MNDVCESLRSGDEQVTAPLCLEDFEIRARARLPASVFAHIAGGSGDERAVQAAEDAYRGYQIVPRVLRDVSEGSTRTRLLDTELAHPVMLGPIAYQRLVHAGAEIETAVAAEALDATFVLSTLASTSLERVAAASDGRKWFQLYLQPERDSTLALVHRAEAAGFEAIVATVDAPVRAMHYRAERLGFGLPTDITAENLAQLEPRPVELRPGDSRVFQGVMRRAPTWRDIAWLRSHTELPLLLKGVLDPGDAARAVGLGADGLIVSGHGGRALNSGPPPLVMLPGVRREVGPDVPLLIDGGIRSGHDVFVALDLGADAVLIGRPQVFALAVDGAQGVARMLRILRDELEVTMALAGCAALADISASHLIAVRPVGGRSR